MQKEVRDRFEGLVLACGKPIPSGFCVLVFGQSIIVSGRLWEVWVRFAILSPLSVP